MHSLQNYTITCCICSIPCPGLIFYRLTPRQCLDAKDAEAQGPIGLGDSPFQVCKNAIYASHFGIIY